ncbi:MAG: M28 family peptidase [Planctomycetota bacterium]
MIQRRLEAAFLLLATCCFTGGVTRSAIAERALQDAAKAQAPPQRAFFDGERSYEYLKAICALGNRMSGSVGMQKQQALMEQHFTQLGASVNYQRFEANNPLSGKPVPMANLMVTWHPETDRRLLLCAHYDTRPLPDRDRDPAARRHGIFLGANDGASGVALLMELGNHVKKLPLDYGIDFVFFDAEELVYSDGRREIGPYFIGSTEFAQRYAKRPPAHEYTAGVLFDMVADRRLNIHQERFSATWSNTRPLVKEIWATAARLGIREFIPRAKYEVRDDHLPLNRIAGIPVCDVIDFEYSDSRRLNWHTTGDSPENCSAESLGKVGRVVVEWLVTRSRN